MPHLRSSYGYDEPEILLPTCRRFCPMSADPGQVCFIGIPVLPRPTRAVMQHNGEPTACR